MRPAESGELAAARAGLVALALLPPAFLMGGMLPLVVRARAREPAHLGGAIARLYAVNTLGGAAGALLAGLALLPALGMRGAMIVAAACNLYAALALQCAP